MAAFLAGVRLAAFLAGFLAAFLAGFLARLALLRFGVGAAGAGAARNGSAGSTGGMLKVSGGGGGSGSLESGVSSIQPPLVQPVSRSSSVDIEAPWIGLRHNQPPGMARKSRHRAL